MKAGTSQALFGFPKRPAGDFAYEKTIETCRAMFGNTVTRSFHADCAGLSLNAGSGLSLNAGSGLSLNAGSGLSLNAGSGPLLSISRTPLSASWHHLPDVTEPLPVPPVTTTAKPLPAIALHAPYRQSIGLRCLIG